MKSALWLARTGWRRAGARAIFERRHATGGDRKGVYGEREGDTCNKRSDRIEKKPIKGHFDIEGPVGILIVVVIVCLYTGVVTPTEVGAIGASGALVISLFMRRLTVHGLIEALGNTARTTAMIVTIIFGAVIFGYFMTFTQVTDTILTWTSAASLPPLVVLIGVTVVYILLGMSMDQFAIIVLTVPVTYALMKGLGYDGIWYGILIVKTAEIGLVTPPVGLNVFIASAASAAWRRLSSPRSSFSAS